MRMVTDVGKDTLLFVGLSLIGPAICFVSLIMFFRFLACLFRIHIIHHLPLVIILSVPVHPVVFHFSLFLVQFCFCHFFNVFLFLCLFVRIKLKYPLCPAVLRLCQALAMPLHKGFSFLSHMTGMFDLLYDILYLAWEAMHGRQRCKLK